MSVALILAVAGLAAIGTYLVTSRSLSRIVLGFSLLGHAAVLALLAAGGPAGEPPLADRAGPAEAANPLPQALALTAIVISFGLTLFLLALSRREQALTGDDLVEDDLEDRRIARLASQPAPPAPAADSGVDDADRTGTGGADDRVTPR